MQCNMHIGTNNLLRHSRSHEFIKKRLLNGQFSKAIPIKNFEEKGQLFPQNEKNSGQNATKIKIKKQESNEISKSL